MSDKYNVIFFGEINDGFELPSVINAFAQAFKIDNAKAQQYFNGDLRTLKKNIDERTALNFQKALGKLGLIVHLKSLEPVKADSLEFSLEPKHDEIEEAPVKQSAEQAAVSDQKSFCCPKCKVEQKKTEQCISCGIYFEKYFAQQQSKTPINYSLEPKEVDVSDEDIHQEETIDESTYQNEAFNLKAISAAAIAAILGAAVWLGIIVFFNYELGLIAWGIGGLVGFAAATFGGYGEKVGIACGILAMLSIFGGKFLSYEYIINETYDDMRPIYEEQLLNANRYSAAKNSDHQLKQLMIDLEYTYATSIHDIYDEELQEFKQAAAQEFAMMALTQPSFESWMEMTFSDNGLSISTFDMMKEDFGLIDIIFLILGVGTAFRLGRGEV